MHLLGAYAKVTHFSGGGVEICLFPRGECHFSRLSVEHTVFERLSQYDAPTLFLGHFRERFGGLSSHPN